MGILFLDANTLYINTLGLDGEKPESGISSPMQTDG